MPYKVIDFQETPNPNALKCVLDASPAPDGPRSYVKSGPAASADPLGAALMAIPGIHNVLIHHGWITIGKSPDASWKSVKTAVQRALGEAV